MWANSADEKYTKSSRTTLARLSLKVNFDWRGNRSALLKKKDFMVCKEVLKKRRRKNGNKNSFKFTFAKVWATFDSFETRAAVFSLYNREKYQFFAFLQRESREWKFLGSRHRIRWILCIFTRLMLLKMKIGWCGIELSKKKNEKDDENVTKINKYKYMPS